MENLARAGGVQENETCGVSCASDSWGARNGRSYPGPVRAKTKTSPFAVAHMEFGHGMIAVVTDGRKQAVTGIGVLVSRGESGEAGDRRGHVEAGRAGPVGRVALDTCQALYDEVSRERRDAGMSTHVRKTSTGDKSKITDLIFRALRIQHGKQHFSVTVSPGFICLQNFAQGWRRRLMSRTNVTWVKGGIEQGGD